MTTQLNAYLNFRDNAREAMQFYQSVFGGELRLSTFADIPEAGGGDPAEADKIMHAFLATDDGLVIMAADTPASMEYRPAAGFSMSLSGEPADEARLRGYWDALAEGGSVTMPMDVAPWGDTFGMLVDRFGIPWMVDIAGEQSGQGG
jgi:PhnB protein